MEREDMDQIARAIAKSRLIHPSRPYRLDSQSATLDALSQLIREMDLAISDRSSSSYLEVADVAVNLVDELLSAHTTEALVDKYGENFQ
jgi:hypothetical protein